MADQLMYVKEDLILPHHYTFYDFIVTKVRIFKWSLSSNITILESYFNIYNVIIRHEERVDLCLHLMFMMIFELCTMLLSKLKNHMREKFYLGIYHSKNNSIVFLSDNFSFFS